MAAKGHANTTVAQAGGTSRITEHGRDEKLKEKVPEHQVESDEDSSDSGDSTRRPIERTMTASTSKSSAASKAEEAATLKKWRRMLGAGTCDWREYCTKYPEKVHQRIHKGIPDRLRGVVWQLLSGGRELVLQNEGVYEQLLLYEHTDKDLEIVRDLSRTYPSHIYYQQRQGPGQRSLYNVLKAYSVYDNKIGYVQGMGFLAGLLLLYMCEEDAFWTLVALLKGKMHPPLEGLYQHGLPLLHQFTYQFDRLVEEQLPALSSQLRGEGVAAPMFCSQWFITLFAYTLPFEHLTRLWDLFLYSGVKHVFQVGLALMKLSESQLLELPFELLLAVLNGKKFPAFDQPPEAMLSVAHTFKISARLKELKAEYDAMNTPSPPPRPPSPAASTTPPAT